MLFPNSFRSAWQFWRAGIPRVGAMRRRAAAVAHATQPHASRRGVRHQADYYRDLVTRAGHRVRPRRRHRASAPRRRASSAPTRCSRQHGIDAGVPLVGLAPGAAYGSAKQWPPERMAEVTARLVARSRRRCACIFGAAHDRDAAPCDRILAPCARAATTATRVVESDRPDESRRARRRRARSAVSSPTIPAPCIWRPRLAGRSSRSSVRPTSGRRVRSAHHDVHHRTRVLPALHVARLSDRSPVHEANLRRTVCTTPWPRGSPGAGS